MKTALRVLPRAISEATQAAGANGLSVLGTAMKWSVSEAKVRKAANEAARKAPDTIAMSRTPRRRAIRAIDIEKVMRDGTRKQRIVAWVAMQNDREVSITRMTNESVFLQSQLPLLKALERSIKPRLTHTEMLFIMHQARLDDTPTA
jgi:hypothetical protein